MSPADMTPKPLPSGGLRHSPSGPVSPAHPRRNEIAPCQSRNGTLPSAVPAPLSSVSASGQPRTSREEVFATLRASIRRIERTSVVSPFAMRNLDVVAPAEQAACIGTGPDDDQFEWCLGAPEVDRWIGGLDAAGVHEVKPAVPGPGVPAAMSRAAAFVFALRLAARRVSGSMPADAAKRGAILLCVPLPDRLELGRLYGPGLAGLGLDAQQFLIVETAKAADTLWAMEEGLRSQVPAVVIGCLDELPLTPARRLSLAADRHLTPCIAVTAARTSVAGAMATRWRVGAAQSSDPRLDPGSPGLPACVAALERCRHRAGAGNRGAFTLEWCNETFRFRVAASVANREATADAAEAGAS